MNEIWEARRKELTSALERAALDLVQHSNGAASITIPIHGTTPRVYIVIGELADVVAAVNRAQSRKT
ncbi:hypothetical protein [Massilia endophytica]|uniref:hypothetical protein n=1 Tax=Massilia endophytica TaxID=2899220 RepID=UPI001E49D449|nr:hypothetical protein [Massilia endophytica]UGQ45070.1 hypothetical protein LSQ66_14850 [Massilia endophytica]